MSCRYLLQSILLLLPARESCTMLNLISCLSSVFHGVDQGMILPKKAHLQYITSERPDAFLARIHSWWDADRFSRRAFVMESENLFISLYEDRYGTPCSRQQARRAPVSRATT